MTHTLRLTADEREMFASLPQALTEGIGVENEDRNFEDSEHHFQVRWAAVKFESEKLRALERQSAPFKSQEELKQMIETADLTDLPHDDLVGLFFIAGPAALSLTIAHSLMNAKSAEDLEDIAEFTNIRSILLNRFATASPR